MNESKYTLQYVQHHWLSLLKLEYDVFSDQRLDSTFRNTIVKDVFGSDFDMIKWSEDVWLPKLELILKIYIYINDICLGVILRLSK